ncbi:MAG: hypothetical protein GF313_06160 [Caldithrix sp.]|nr:hypothetical protein [Caldithrix sp.]
MRVILWYMDQFAYHPSVKTLDFADVVSDGNSFDNAVVAFIHAEAKDENNFSKVTTKLVKNLKWLAKKWECTQIVLHSFAHLSESKSNPDLVQEIFDNVQNRLTEVGYTVDQTPFGYFLDVQISAPGQSLARVYKEF